MVGCATYGVLWEALKCIEVYQTKMFMLHGNPVILVRTYFYSSHSDDAKIGKIRYDQ